MAFRLKAGDYRRAALLMHDLAVTTDIQDFRSVLFDGLQKAAPGAVFTLNALGQPEGSIYCVREGRKVHDDYAREMPDLWPAQSLLLDFPPVTERRHAATLGRQRGTPSETDVSACKEFFSKLHVDDAAAMLLNHRQEYLGLLCVNTLHLSEGDKTRLEDFLELIGPSVSAQYGAVTHRQVMGDLCTTLTSFLESSGSGYAILDIHGVLQAASGSVVKAFEGMSRTDRHELRQRTSSWLAQQLGLPAGAGKALTFVTCNAHDWTLRFVRRLGDPATGVAWFLLEVALPQSRDNLLSLRELEIAEAVANGATDTDIGIFLHLSPFTVKRHVSNILRKLGLNNRGSLARWYMYVGAAHAEHRQPVVGLR